MTADGLSSGFITHILEKVCPDFYGVFSSNTIPMYLKKITKFVIVVNLAKAEHEGTHFITIVRISQKVLFIDSFGLPCREENISKFLKELEVPIYYNETQIQSFASNFCGFYAIFFCLKYSVEKKKSRNLTFSENLQDNDDKCVIYVLRMIE